MNTRYVFSVLVLSLLSLGILGCEENHSADINMRTTVFEDAQNHCTHGGVKIEILVDGKVDDAQTQYICNTTNDADAKIQTTPFEGAQGECNNGGVKIEILVDGEVDNTQTQYICNTTSDADAKIQTTSFEGSQGECNNGGTKVEVLINGVIQEEQTQYICRVTVKDIRVGDTITFGHYEQDNDTSNGKEPILWRVIDINEDGQFLIISEYVLDAQSYNTINTTITWEKSTIRSWLNGYSAEYNTVGNDYTSDNFINTAFTQEEIAKIVESDVPAHLNTEYTYTPGSSGNDTTDKIFFLSLTEAKTYFRDNSERSAEATLYAIKRGTSVKGSNSNNYTTDGTCADPKCNAIWWLRTPGYTADAAAYVYGSGALIPFGYSVYLSIAGIRPVLRINY